MALLAEYGRECAGAVVVVPAGEGLPTVAQQSLAKVDRQALLDEAKAMGLPARAAEQALDELSSHVRSGIDNLPTDITEGWPSENLIETVLARSHRLETGQPLGGAKQSSRPSRTLDMITADKQVAAPARREATSTP